MGRTFDRKYPALKAREILPVFTGVDPAAEVYAWKSYDKTGAAGLVDDYSADQPSTEVTMNEYSTRILSIGTSYSYSIMDLRRSRMAGIPLETRKAMTAREAMERAFEQIAFFGFSQVPGSVGQALRFQPGSVNSNDPLAAYGFCNFPGLTGAQYNGRFATAGRTLNNWTLDSTDDTTIANDFTSMRLSVINTSDGVHEPNCVVLPLSIWSYLSSRPQSATFKDKTTLDYLKAVNPWLKNIYWTPMLEGAGLKQDGATAGPRIMCFERNEENLSSSSRSPSSSSPRRSST